MDTGANVKKVRNLCVSRSPKNSARDGLWPGWLPREPQQCCSVKANQDIQRRVAEIQSLGAERAAITVETLIAKAESARSKAMGEKRGAAAAIAAITTKAKLAGLWREKVAQTDPSGEHAPRYIISERPMTEEEWIRERCSE
jgi:hypothetical protein